MVTILGDFASDCARWFIGLLIPLPETIDLARVQWQVREERRAELERGLSGMDARACMARVRRRMVEGDSVWLPPMHGRDKAFRAWKLRHRSWRNVADISKRPLQEKRGEGR